MELRPYRYTRWMMSVTGSRAGIKVIAAGRQCRKTSFMVCHLLDTMERVPGCHVIMVEPSRRMVERVVRPMIVERMDARGMRVVKSDSAHTTSGLGVFHHVSAAVSVEGVEYEVGAVDEPDFTALEPMRLAVRAKRLIVAGTPRPRRKGDPRSWFERWYRNGRPGKNFVKSWRSWRVSSEGFVPARVWKCWRASLGPAHFKAEFEGRFVTYTDKEVEKRG